MLTKTEKLKQLLNILNDGITQAEFVKSFKSVIEHILKLEKKLIERVDGKTATEEEALKKLNEDFNKVISQAKKESDSTFSGIKRRIFETITTLFAKSQIKDKVDDKIKEVDEKLSQIRNGVDADEDRVSIIASERAIETIKPLIPTIDTPEQIADKLEVLKDDNRLKISAIDKLREELDELKSRPIGGRGGARKVVYTKRINLTDQCNGTLKEFTMPKDCIDVLAVYGTQFPITFDEADFTFEGQTLTLTSEVGAPQTGQTLFALIQTLFYGKI